MNVLVTGGAGYIGSHTCLELLAAGHGVVVVDNLSNASEESLIRVSKLVGKEIKFHRLDIRDQKGLREVFDGQAIEAVVHFAGLKAVGESSRIPRDYYDNNVAGTLSLLEVMAEFNVHHLVFSSSATVYGDPHQVPVREDFPTGSPTNPYGKSKLMIEEILKDLAASDKSWNVSLLRYFNPVGAHESGLIGEDPSGTPNNLMPYIAQVAVGKMESLAIFGNDYPTPDGTGVRDYIHVVDLAKGHLAAMECHRHSTGVHIYNLGTGQGRSVLEMLRAFEKACGTSLNHHIAPRRPGDIAVCYADPTLAEERLGWRATRTLDEMTADTWRWQSENPSGYRQ